VLFRSPHSPCIDMEAIMRRHAEWKSVGKVVETRCCSSCSAKKDRWLCLTCGDVVCGRKSKDHTSSHTAVSTHLFFISLDNKRFFCHVCNDYIALILKEDLKIFISTELGRTNIPCRELRLLLEMSQTIQTRPTTGSRRKKFNSVTGLSNLGNTCYINSVLQTFAHTHSIRQHYSLVKSLPRSLSIDCLLQTLLEEMWTTDCTIIVPEAFLAEFKRRVPQFEGHHQHDAQEFIRYLLDLLSTENASNSGNPAISDLFTGEMENEICCMACSYSSVTSEKFTDISLSMPARMSKTISIQDCLDRMFEKEILDDPYDCPMCGKPQQVSKRPIIKNLPEILCLHIKRTDLGMGTNLKSASSLQFSLSDLDMTPYATSPLLHHHYDLYSCIVHISSIGGTGHFISYTWSIQESTWFQLNDSFTSPIPATTLSQVNPYLLFYVRKPFPTMINSSQPITRIAEEDGINLERCSSVTPSMSSCLTSVSSSFTSDESCSYAKGDGAGGNDGVVVSMTVKDEADDGQEDEMKGIVALGTPCSEDVDFGRQIDAFYDDRRCTRAQLRRLEQRKKNVKRQKG